MITTQHSTSTRSAPNSPKCSKMSDWQYSFDCSHIRPLIVCRGPVRKEAIDVFKRAGIKSIGVLLSHNDCLQEAKTQAPELRCLRSSDQIHIVKEYSVPDTASKFALIDQIIDICKEFGYNTIFAGYGFMAEDHEFIAQLESQGLLFIGPSSSIAYRAGLKSSAKNEARSLGVSVVDGIDSLGVKTLLALYPKKLALLEISEKHGIQLPSPSNTTSEMLARELLKVATEKNITLYQPSDLAAVVANETWTLALRNPTQSFRLKWTEGGGGKGQRVIPSLSSFAPELQETTFKELCKTRAIEALKEGCVFEGSCNPDILLEFNLDKTRHLEVQVVGNGHWYMSLGARDCSIQSGGQKLVEISLTEEGLDKDIERSMLSDEPSVRECLNTDKRILKILENEALLFSEHMGLNSVSTYESIVAEDQQYFMEMNTRIQVEHRVSELCYSLVFTNPSDVDDTFEVTSLIHLMLLLAVHGPALPKPKRTLRYPAAVEIRLNATDDRLLPHVGGQIEYWSPPSSDELRDDQGIGLAIPHSGQFAPYKLMGSYDSNIALIVTHGDCRHDALLKMSRVLATMRLYGENLKTNQNFHRGLIDWLLATNINFRPMTCFTNEYLLLIAKLNQLVSAVDVSQLYDETLTLAHSSAELAQWESHYLNNRKQLVIKPLQKLFDNPHLLMGWLMQNQKRTMLCDNDICVTENPLRTLQGLYHYLQLDESQHTPNNEKFWQNDQADIEKALAFYRKLANRSSLESLHFHDLNKLLRSGKLFPFINGCPENDIRQVHEKYQVGLQLLKIFSWLIQESHLDVFDVDMTCRLTTPFSELKENERQILLDSLSSQDIDLDGLFRAPSAGILHLIEAENTDPLIYVGRQFEVGDVLFYIEVMKMILTVRAPFAGHIAGVVQSEDKTPIKREDIVFEYVPIGTLPQRQSQQMCSFPSDFLSNIVKY